ncbi:hypothetical protein D3C81_2226380 [compost metagenome]
MTMMRPESMATVRQERTVTVRISMSTLRESIATVRNSMGQMTAFPDCSNGGERRYLPILSLPKNLTEAAAAILPNFSYPQTVWAE